MTELASLSVRLDTNAAKAANELEKFERAADGVADKVEELGDAGRAAAKGVDDLGKKVEQVGQKVKPVGKQIEDVARGARTLPSAASGMSNAVDKITQSAAANGRAIQLQGYQVRNLTAQFVDFGVQIGSGGGLLYPLIQQGPQAVDAMGGVGNAVALVKERLMGLSTAAKIGLGTAGVLGIVGLATKAVYELAESFTKASAPGQFELAVDRKKAAADRFKKSVADFFGLTDAYVSSGEKIAGMWNSLADRIERANNAQKSYNATASASPAIPPGMTAGEVRRRTILAGGAGLAVDSPGDFAKGGIRNSGPTPFGSVFEMGPTSPKIEAEIAKLAEAAQRLAGDDVGLQVQGRIEELTREHLSLGEKGLVSSHKTAEGIVRVHNAAKTAADITARSGERVSGRVAAGAESTRAGLSAVERAIGMLGGRMGGGGGGGNFVSRSYSGDQGDGSFEDAERITAIDRNPFEPTAGGSMFPNSNLPSLRGQGNTITSVLPEGSQIRGSPGSYGLWYNQKGGVQLSAAERLKMGLPVGQAATGGGAASKADLSILDPVGGLIERLRDQQSDVMGRAYTPDPYKEKNPDWFYSSGKMHGGEQDKIWTRLQGQIDKLTEISTTSAELLAQGKALPAELSKALIAAMIQAGLSGEQIANAFARASTSGAPAPTAQPGPLPNRRLVANRAAFDFRIG